MQTTMIATMPAPTRRGFLKGLGAGLVIGIGTSPAAASAAAGAGTAAATVNRWLHIGADGTVTLYSNAQEMGQGAMSGVAQVLADELRLPWDAVRVETAPLVPEMGMAQGAGHWTGGSSSIRSQWDLLRKAGASAREMLVQAGAARMGVAAADCRAEDGRVVHRGGRSVPYAEVATAAAALPVPESPTLLSRSDWRLIGRPLPRKDIPSKVDGSAIYATDIKLPGLLTAAIRHSPVFGGKLVSVDPAPALAVKGVRHVVPMQGVVVRMPSPQGGWDFRLADAVAVVADGWWAAKKGLEALRPVWNTGGNEVWDTARIESALTADLATPGDERIFGEDPATVKAAHAAGKAAAARTFTADYATPYLAHALMEPLSAVAHVRADGAEVWSGCQAPTDVETATASLTGLPKDRVKAHVLYSGGGFGRRYIKDYVVQAVHLSKAVGAPVKLIWSREEELAQGRYRPATAARLTAHLGADGVPAALDLAFASNRDDQFVLIRPPGFEHPPEYAPPYLLKGALTTVRQNRDLTVPTGPWRAPGSTQNAFYVESFFDELAHAAGLDPLEYRRRLLAGNPRPLRVLNAAAEAAGWGSPLPKGRGRGIAIWNSFQSISAQVAEVSVEGDALRIHRITCAIDCGTAVNPDSIRAQGEGSIIMALSATLAEKLEVAGGAVTTVNFDTYPLLTLAETPPIEVVVLESPDAPVGGVGEPMTPPLPPALANAIFAASGRRLRSLPLSAHGLRLV